MSIQSMPIPQNHVHPTITEIITKG